MKNERKVYLLDPQKYSPETIAVTFAKTSRSPESFREIAAELTDAASAKFNEKWVVGYGHSSVAEHAVLHLAIENVSRLAVETLESNRLASYTEKSTRYQTWGAEAYYIPAELTDSSLRKVFIQPCTRLFETYRTCLDAVMRHLELSNTPVEDETSQQAERRIRSQAVDACRFLLPAASLANVGMTINARALEHALGKLLSHPLRETRQIGAEIKAVSQAALPSLLKYADEIPYLQHVCDEFSAVQVESPEKPGEWCRLVHYDADGIEKMLASALYHEQYVDYAQAVKQVSRMPIEERQRLLDCLLNVPDRHTIPARELESAAFTFDLLVDQGAYFEIKRHRMMTQIPQQLTAGLGYAIPRVIESAGVLAAYQSAMEEARAAWQQLAGFDPHVAAYIVPNGFNRRVLLTVNLRSLVHFIKLRSAPNAHFSVRRAAQRMAELVAEALPELIGRLGKHPAESAASIERAYFLNLSA